jgi:hypothetical protein
MPVGRNQEKKRFLHLSYGKFREKAVENATGAEARTNKDGKILWEYVYDYLEGSITKVFYKESKDYGNSFEVVVDDGKEKFQASFKEGDNFYNDFFSKLPNVDLSKWVKLVPYDFDDENTGKKKRGLTVWQNDAKVESKFTSYNSETKKFSYFEGFPEPEKNMESEDWKIYFIKVVKFLRKYTNDKIIPKLIDKAEQEKIETLDKLADEIEKNNDPTTDNDDLPF